MKAKRFLLAGIALFIASFSFGQFQTGVKIGANFNTVSTADFIGNILPDIGFITTPSYGAVASYKTGDHFEIYSELMYRTKGFRIKKILNLDSLANMDINLPIGARVDSKINYLSMPLLAKYTFGQTDAKVRGYLALGPEFAYATNAKVEVTPILFVELNKITTNIDLERINYNRFEVSGTLAGGLTIPFGSNSIFFDARYTMGLMDNLKVPVIDAKIQNRGFSINLGYMYAF